MIGQILKSLISSLGMFGADGFVSFTWFDMSNSDMLHSWLWCRMSRTQTEMISVS